MKNLKKLTLITLVAISMLLTCSSYAKAQKIFIGKTDMNNDGISESIFLKKGHNYKYSYYSNLIVMDGKTNKNIFIPPNNKIGNIPNSVIKPRIVGKYIYHIIGGLSYSYEDIYFIIYGFDKEAEYVLPLYTKKIKNETTDHNLIFKKAKKTPAKAYYYYRNLYRVLKYAENKQNDKLDKYLKIEGCLSPAPYTPKYYMKKLKRSEIQIIKNELNNYNKTLVVWSSKISCWIQFNDDGTKIVRFEGNREYDAP